MMRSAVTAVLCLVGMLAGSRACAADAGPAQHTTRIVFLGTYGGPGARKLRSEPATLLVVDGTPYLVDIGPGTDRQLAFAGVRHRDVKAVFITHHHIDHDGGLVPFISLTWFEKAWYRAPPSTVAIYGPPATAYLVRTALDYLSVSERIFRAGMPALAPSDGMFEAHDVANDGPFYSDGVLRATAARNAHYVFPSQGPTGETDKSFAYRFDTPSGSVVFTGDTGPSDAVVRLAQGADVLVSEVCLCKSTPYSPADSVTGPPEGLAAQQRFHMVHEHLSPEEVGRMATDAHVKTVLLTHFVPGDDDVTDLSGFTSGVRRTYAGNVIAAHDLYEFDLP